MGVAGIASGLTAGSVGSAQAGDACGGVTRAQFDEYLALFNNNDPGFIKFYHPDVVLELGATQIKTPQGIRDFYAEVKAHIREKVEVNHFISDATGIAAELPTEFKVYRDWENGFFQRPLKAGEVMRTISFVLYWVENGQFKHIKSARYRQINDWRMES
ncbi:MAG TPA: nuclear transport factor 2 family protein [Alphaproteobacteria bacterium]|nr:nuclear transport factor 2 family protein [Alphaproteobacteria bacterium]